MALYPFQQEAVQKSVRFLSQRGSTYNASEQGTGKTIVTIRSIEDIAKVFSREIRVLVICPAIVKLVWEDEIKKWAVNKRVKYSCLSYDSTWRTEVDPAIDFLVLDEVHYIKNPKAKRTKAVLKLWPNAKYVIALSGTPFMQSIMDCWPVFSRMAPEDFGDYWTFAKEFVNIEKTIWGPKYKFVGVKNHERLKKLINEKFFFRYTKEKVLKELPEKTYQCIPLGPKYLVKANDEEQKRYLELLKQSIVANTAPPVPPIPIASLLREQGIKKVPAIAEFVKNLLDSEVPVVLFACHTEVIEQLKESLKEFNPVVITGFTNEKDRAEAVKSFQEGTTTLFIGQVKAAGVGITLTRSSTVVFAELSYSPADISQAIDRCHRISQKNAVNIYYFSVLGSIDEKIQKVLIEKSSTFKKVLE